MQKVKNLIQGFKKPASKKVNDLSLQEVEHYRDPILAWNAASFIKFQRTKSWYIVSSILLLLVIVSAVLLGSPTFAIAVIVFAMVYVFLTQDDPEAVQVVISDIGIIFGNKVYPYTDIRTFWIEYQPPTFQSLHLVLKKEFSEEVTINFHGINPTDLRLVLSKFLPEWEEREKNFTENLTRMLGL